MDKKQLYKYIEETSHSQRMLAWIIIEFIFLIILAAIIIYIKY